MNKEVSFIIVNFYSGKFTNQCISSIQQHCSDLNYEVIVADNNSKIGDRELFEHLRNVKVIDMGYNSGFSRANNAAIKKAAGDFIVIINPDIILVDDCIQQCLELFPLYEGMPIGIIGCKLLRVDGVNHAPYQWNMATLEKTIQQNPVYSYFFSHKIKQQREGWQVRHRQCSAVSWVSGAVMIMKRSTLLMHNLFFDEDFFLYFEGPEIGYRARRQGLQVIYNAEEAAIHVGRVSGTTSLFRFKQGTVSGWLYMMKTKGKFIFIINQFLVSLNILCEEIIYRSNNIRNKNTFRDHKAKWFRNLKWKLLLKYSPAILTKYRRKISSAKEMLIAK